MHVDDFEKHATAAGFAVGRLAVGDQVYLHLSNIQIGAGTREGSSCDVAILRTAESPWVPQAAVHVKPHLVAMGERNSQASPLGADWQYLSRRFDKVPTARSFLAHVLTVLAEL